MPMDMHTKKKLYDKEKDKEKEQIQTIIHLQSSLKRISHSMHLKKSKGKNVLPLPKGAFLIFFHMLQLFSSTKIHF